MEKYRIISRWTNDYYPLGYRQDGEPQERVEVLNLFSEEEAKRDLEYFNKHLTNGAWVAERYEIDDDKYRCFELILPQEAPVAKQEEPIIIKEPLVVTRDVEPSMVIKLEDKTPDVAPKKRNKIQGIEILASNKQPEIMKVEEIFGPTKTIYVVKYIATQRELGNGVQKINGRILPEERKKIYNDFNNNVIGEISITEAVARLGGVRYDKNGKEIDIKFLDNIDHHTKEFILSKINTRF